MESETGSGGGSGIVSPCAGTAPGRSRVGERCRRNRAVDEEPQAARHVRVNEATARAARLGPRLLLIKVGGLAALAIAGALVARLPAVRAWMAPAGHLSDWFRDMGWVGGPVFILATAALIFVGVPRLPFCPLAGAVFGFWWGLVTSTVATMLAYYSSFLFIRGRLAARDEPAELPSRLSFLRYDPGVAGVIRTRLIPVPGLWGTIALSLSPVGRRSFLFGSL